MQIYMLITANEPKYSWDAPKGLMSPCCVPTWSEHCGVPDVKPDRKCHLSFFFFLFIFVFSNFRQANADSWKHSSRLGKSGKIVYIHIYLMFCVDFTYIYIDFSAYWQLLGFLDCSIVLSSPAHCEVSLVHNSTPLHWTLNLKSSDWVCLYHVISLFLLVYNANFI